MECTEELIEKVLRDYRDEQRKDETLLRVYKSADSIPVERFVLHFASLAERIEDVTGEHHYSDWRGWRLVVLKVAQGMEASGKVVVSHNPLSEAMFRIA